MRYAARAATFVAAVVLAASAGAHYIGVVLFAAGAALAGRAIADRFTHRLA